MTCPAATARLRLRAWRAADRQPLRALNADAQVMAYFPSTLNAAQSDALFDRIVAHHMAHGFGLWAVERADTADFIGFTGLSIPQWQPCFGPCVEIGWRLAAAHWGQGFATEAARTVLAFAFESLGLDEVVSFTAAVNTRSERVMERIGMHHAPSDDFDHPALPPGHPLTRHVLYRLSKDAWTARHRQ